MLHGSAVEFFLLIIEMLIVTLVGGGLLKASCALFNLLVGSADQRSSLPDSYSEVALPEAESESLAAAGRVANTEGSELQSSAITTAPLAEQARQANASRVEKESIVLQRGVSPPSYEWAMCIEFVVILVNVMSYFILTRVFRLAGLAVGTGTLRSAAIFLSFYPLAFLIQGGINTVMLPTSFGKGLLVALILLLLSSIVAAILFVIFFVFGVSMALSNP